MSPVDPETQHRKRRAWLRLLPLGLALVLGFSLHLFLLAGLDLEDLPGPGGVLLVRDLLLGEHAQGPASWLGLPLVALGLRADLAARLMMSGGLLVAMLGAALAAWALAGRRAAPWAALLTASWVIAAHQAWLMDPGGPAWGLSWLGLGLAWWGCTRHRLGLAATGAGLLALGVAAKASALPVLALLVVAPWLRSPGDAPAPVQRAWLWRGVSLAVGLAVGAALGWALQGPDQPWIGAQAAAGGDGAGWLLAVLALPERGLAQGWFGPALGLGLLGAGLLARRQPLALAVLLLAALSLAMVGEARAERLQPRHLLPASLGLVVLVASLGCWRRPPWVPAGLLALLCGILALDSLAFAGAFAQQRVRFEAAAPAALPSAPALLARRYPELPWTVFHQSSIAGASELMAQPTAAQAVAVVASPPYQERRDTHLEVAARLAGQSYLRLTAERCCTPGQDSSQCAADVVAGLDAAGVLLVLPGKVEVVSPEARPFAQALFEAAPDQRRRTRWNVVRGRGEGAELPCRSGR